MAAVLQRLADREPQEVGWDQAAALFAPNIKDLVKKWVAMVEEVARGSNWGFEVLYQC